MSWYDPRSWGSTGKNALNAVAPVTALFGSTRGSIGDSVLGDPNADRKRQLDEQAAAAGRFGDAGQAGYGQLGQQGQANIAGLQRIASGQDSVTAEQLRQALAQNVANQRSLAAGAAPQNAAMAARTAAIQSGRLGAGLAGQQALAGLQERNQAQMQLTGAIQGLRGQDLQAALGGRGQAIQGYGGGSVAPEKSWIEKYGPMIASVAGLAASDRRLKTDVKDGDEGATKMLDGLRSFTYRYKDEGKFGAGERTGIVAQDLERAGIKHAVIDTPQGKMIHGGHLSTANTAMLAALRDRVAKLERS